MSVQRLAAGRMPPSPARRVERSLAPPRAALPTGVAEGRHGSVRVLLDLQGQRLERHDERNASHTAAVAVHARQDLLTPGLVAVDPPGRRALVMACRSAHGDAGLLLVDFDAQTTQVVHSTEGPGWVVGGFFGREDNGIVACEQRLGDDPRFRVLVLGPPGTPAREVLAVRGMQQPCVPCGWGDELVALVVCPVTDPLTLTGPSSLCVLDPISKNLVALAPAEGTHVRKDRGALVVEGGPEVVRVTPDAP